MERPVVSSSRRQAERATNHPLFNYAIGVVVALALMLALTWVAGGEARLKTALVFALGFLAGMLSMFIKGRLMGVF